MILSELLLQRRHHDLLIIENDKKKADYMLALPCLLKIKIYMREFLIIMLKRHFININVAFCDCVKSFEKRGLFSRTSLIKSLSEKSGIILHILYKEEDE